MVVGSVGSGKSTLAGALLGEVAQTVGTRSIKGSVAYVAQEAWIVNASLRDNVLFGNEFDEEKYNKVIFSAALR
jgi:ATP-binding cassette subfamily C (CFTR/MRP) protein 5